MSRKDLINTVLGVLLGVLVAASGVSVVLAIVAGVWLLVWQLLAVGVFGLPAASYLQAFGVVAAFFVVLMIVRAVRR